jgi:penicillin-insensitive murein endopeptidase
MKPRLIPVLLLLFATFAGAAALAQDKGSVDPKPLPPLANPNDPKLGAKELFGRKVLPAAMPTRVIGFYAKGCIAGAKALPINGETWQVMRLSRNRNWGHPDLVALLKAAVGKAHKDAAGRDTGRRHVAAARRPDVHRPRQPSGRARRRHLADADAEPRIVAQRARGNVGGHDGAPDRLDIDPNVWTPGHLAVIRAAAQEPSVQRIFVNAAIKKALCREAKGDRSWLTRCGRCTATTITSISASNARRQRRMRSQPAPGGRRRLQRRRSRLLVQGFGAASEAAENAAEAETADDDGAIAGRLPAGAGRAGCEAIARRRHSGAFARTRNPALPHPDNAVSLLARAFPADDRKSAGSPPGRNGASACRIPPQPTPDLRARQRAATRMERHHASSCRIFAAFTILCGSACRRRWRRTRPSRCSPRPR